MFQNIIGFASDKRFVNLHFPFNYLAVYNNLVTYRENKEIAVDDLLLADLANLTIPDNRRALLGNETHFVDGFLGADFVDNTDKGISNGDEYKKKIFVAADKKNHDSEDKVDKVEDSESVFKDDFADRIGLLLRGAVDAALANFLGSFCICEPGKFHKEIIA